MKKGLLLLGRWADLEEHLPHLTVAGLPSHRAEPPRDLLIAIGALLMQVPSRTGRGSMVDPGSSPPSGVLGVFKSCS